MRNKTFVPGFLYDFPHARAYKGGGAPTVQPPAYEPPTPKPPQSPDSAVSYEVARDYFKDNVYSGQDQAFTDPWNDSFNQWAGGLESTYGVDSYTKLNYGQMTGSIKPGGGSTTDAPTPPAPDAPVKASDGTLLSAPTATAPTPPVSDRSSEVQQAGREARRNAKKRRGMLSTFLAGETGGASNPVKTLLGQ
jgi:hypothetical protein